MIKILAFWDFNQKYSTVEMGWKNDNLKSLIKTWDFNFSLTLPCRDTRLYILFGTWSNMGPWSFGHWSGIWSPLSSNPI